MLLDDDIVADGEAEPGALASRFGRKERVEDLVLHLRRDASAIVADTDLYAIAAGF